MGDSVCNYAWICVSNNWLHTRTHAGREVICYESPRPPAGIHRVVFVLFQQMVRGSVDQPPLLRHNFCTRNFAVDHGLGAPVAAAFFTCQPEGGTGGRRHVLRQPRTSPAS